MLAVISSPVGFLWTVSFGILIVIPVALIFGIAGMKRGMAFFALWTTFSMMGFYAPTLIGYSLADERVLILGLSAVGLMLPSAWLTFPTATRSREAYGDLYPDFQEEIQKSLRLTGKGVCKTCAGFLRRTGLRGGARALKKIGKCI